MSKHTQGPWFYKRVSTGFTVSALHPKSGSCNAHRICSTSDGCGHYSEGDARLIAAAPDLLEALEKAVARQGFSNDELIDARAAIAKAKGKA